jgi:hypothetical protein
MRIKWDKVLEAVDLAMAQFTSMGVKPTLRTIFYWLYSKQIIPNNQSSYQMLSRKIRDARMEGRYDWDSIEDTTRISINRLGDEYPDEDIIEELETKLMLDIEKINLENLLIEHFDSLKPDTSIGKWANQDVVPLIWLEKVALLNTIYSWTKDLGVPIRVGRGYSSWTFAYEVSEELNELLGSHNKVVVLYLGDLDPSGVDANRFIQQALYDTFSLSESEVEVKWLAVTPEQVEQYNLPPRPEDVATIMKIQRDPRYKSYKNQYIVELDSLLAYAPEQFKNSILEAVQGIWDKETYEEEKQKAQEIEEEIDELIKKYMERAREEIKREIKES